MKKQLTRLLGVVFVLGITGATAQGFEAEINITGELVLCVNESTILNATWVTNRDVTRYEWLVDSDSQGEVEISDGASSGSTNFEFDATDLELGEYEVCLRIWHHNPNQSDRVATKCVTIEVVECKECFIEETAWAAGEPYNPDDQGGNWATYTPYEDDGTANLYAGQTLVAGTVHFSAAVGDEVVITITLDPGWRFADVSENVKIQDYEEAPSGNPAPGQFNNKDYADPNESSFNIVVPEANYYGVHVDVERQIDCPED